MKLSNCWVLAAMMSIICLSGASNSVAAQEEKILWCETGDQSARSRYSGCDWWFSGDGYWYASCPGGSLVGLTKGDEDETYWLWRRPACEGPVCDTFSKDVQLHCPCSGPNPETFVGCTVIHD